MVSAFETAFMHLSMYVFSSPQATGVYLLTFLFFALMMFRIEFAIGLIILIPVDVVLISYGYMVPLVGGLHILICLFVLGFRFLRQK